MFKMKGVIPPMVTPFDAAGNVDYLNLEKLAEYLSVNVDGLFITGSYGSGPLMSDEERMKVVETTIKAVRGKIPVIVMTGTASNKSTVELSKHAESAGAAAVSAVGPYYYKHNADSIKEYYSDMVRGVGIPVYVYNNPGFQGYPMSLDLVKGLKAVGASGIKDATFDILQFATYMRVLKDKDFDVALGTESMWLSACSLGCEAFIPGLGSAFPEICRKMYEEGMRGDFKACRETQFEVNAIRDVMYFAKSTQLAVYAMLEIRGIIRAYPRKPFLPPTQAEKEEIRNALKGMGLI